MENIGDIIDKNLIELEEKKITLCVELDDCFHKVLENFEIAVSAFASQDKILTAQLLRHKHRINELERNRHFRRLHAGLKESFETSAVHLDVLTNLKRIYSHLTAVAYPILENGNNDRGFSTNRAQDANQLAVGGRLLGPPRRKAELFMRTLPTLIIIFAAPIVARGQIERIWLTHRTSDPSRLVVNWETAVPGDSVVHFGVTAQRLGIVSQHDSVTLHHVEIATPLRNVVYHYSVQTGTNESPDYTFRAYPTDELRVAVAATGRAATSHSTR